MLRQARIKFFFGSSSHVSALVHVLHSVHALQRCYVKSCGVCFPSPLVIIGYDVLPDIILLEGRVGVSLLMAQ